MMFKNCLFCDKVMYAKDNKRYYQFELRKYCSHSCGTKSHMSKGGDLARFWASVEKTDTCWNWTGKLSDGYGFINIGGLGRHAHYHAYQMFVAKVPKGFHVDHLCRNRACVNPAHLEAVTPRENNMRGFSPFAINARKTQCKYGHEFTPENTYSRPTGAGKRNCRICLRNAVNKYAAKRRLLALQEREDK